MSIPPSNQAKRKCVPILLRTNSGNVLQKPAKSSPSKCRLLCLILLSIIDDLTDDKVWHTNERCLNFSQKFKEHDELTPDWDQRKPEPFQSIIKPMLQVFNFHVLERWAMGQLQQRNYRMLLEFKTIKHIILTLIRKVSSPPHPQKRKLTA
ncbi:hypothetical protein CDAR_444981 [Caerostris darwini]|uniref:Uncharacterized protein n=1 Tax=Caerostris darwini TaxID=1538125 RepID=A0AAV4MSE5_9ARAC|nr:hypothetical protein CDAR_444981 [Caerostris darwini]